jgi:hypothetical protein
LRHTSQHGERGLRADLAAAGQIAPAPAVSRGLDPGILNPAAVAYYEAAGWRAYYDRNWLRAFGLLEIRDWRLSASS